MNNKHVFVVHLRNCFYWAMLSGYKQRRIIMTETYALIRGYKLGNGITAKQSVMLNRWVDSWLDKPKREW